jgi:hypothetical protein
MAREPWKCPYDDCDAQSGRHWNLKRHIERLHDDIGIPVKSKRLVKGQSLPTLSSEDISHLALNGGYHGHKIHVEKDDSINNIYKIFKKEKNKYDMVKEMIDFFPEPYRHAFSPALHIPPNVGAFLGDPPVGFRTYICDHCLSGPIDPIALSDFRKRGFLAFNLQHTCKQEDLQARRQAAEKNSYDFITKWSEVRQLSISYLSFIVHQWVGSGKDIFLKAIEEPSLRPQIMDSLSTNLGKLDKSHWAYKSVSNGNKVTVIDDKELLDFFHNSLATAAPFRAEIDGKERYFYLIVLLW